MEDTFSNQNITLLTERSVGGGVIREGEFEIMIHRRLTKDDARGVG